jgi:hypothetical protein
MRKGGLVSSIVENFDTIEEILEVLFEGGRVRWKLHLCRRRHDRSSGIDLAVAQAKKIKVPLKLSLDASSISLPVKQTKLEMIKLVIEAVAMEFVGPLSVMHDPVLEEGTVVAGHGLVGLRQLSFELSVPSCFEEDTQARLGTQVDEGDISEPISNRSWILLPSWDGCGLEDNTSKAWTVITASTKSESLSVTSGCGIP